ncbi:ABC transporter substrate-binding protein [Micromonospora sp. NPDC048830]|uniref:ABC transporter substrate-binding protein n=1 Tax=Micromonospora sp. NPDC048830 TaxID=3364257 RepID=UPI0037222D0B
MKIHRNTRLTLLSLVVATWFLAACDANGSGGSGSGEPDPDATLRIAISTPVGDNLNPNAFDALWQAQAMMFEPLVRYGDGGKTEPALAESWTVSEDGLDYDFHLRPNVTFTDGAPWNAEAAVFGLKQWVGNSRFDFLEATEAISGIKALDDMTVRLTLAKPFPGLLQELSIVRPVRFFSPKAAGPNGKYRGDPVGTGPFILQSNSRSKTVFVRNPHYWGKEPQVAKVELDVIPDAMGRLTALRVGEVDMIGGAMSAPLSPHDAEQLSGGDTQVIAAPGDISLLIAFNDDQDRVMHDLAVRKAVNLAIDRVSIAKAIYLGRAKPIGSLFPPAVPYSFAKDAPTPDPDQARQVLEDAGWTGDHVREKDGKALKLEMLISKERLPAAREVGEAIQAQLADVGIKVELADLDHATSHDRIPKRQYDMALTTTYGAPYDPNNTLKALMLSTVESGVDGKIYRNPEFDPLINKALAAQSDEDRKAAYQALNQYLDKVQGFGPLLVQDRIWAVGSRVHGVRPASTDYEFPLEGIWIEKS